MREDLRELLRRGVLRVDLVRDPPQEGFVGERLRIQVRGEHDQDVERDFELLARVQRQVVDAAFERDDPPVEQVARADALPPEVVDEEDAAVRFELKRRLVELRDVVEAQVQHLERQLSADGHDRTLDSHPPAIAGRGLDDRRPALLGHVQRLMVDRIEHGDDLPVDVDRVRHEHVAAERPAYSVGEHGLSIARRAVKEDRLSGVHRRTELVERFRRRRPDG